MFFNNGSPLGLISFLCCYSTLVAYNVLTRVWREKNEKCFRTSQILLAHFKRGWDAGGVWVWVAYICINFFCVTFLHKCL